MTKQDQGVEMVTIVGPTTRRPDGSVKESMPPREIPKRQWDNKASRSALVAAGMRLQSEAFDPAVSEKRGPGRPSTTQKQIDAMAKKIAELEAQNAALKSTENPSADAGQA